MRLLTSLCMALLAGIASFAHAESILSITYLERQVTPPPTLSNLDPIPEDLGLAGAQVGLNDNNTTGKFLKQKYELKSVIVAPDQPFLPAAEAALEAGAQFFVVKASAEDLLAFADLPGAQNVLIINAGAPDNALRSSECRATILHTLPSRSMLTDALAQFAVKKRWTRWAMIVGPKPGDAAFAEAVERSAKKFNLRLRSTKQWTVDTDMRRSAFQEIPLFTQGLRDHDMLIIADEINDFGRYVLYNTWDARPVAGTQGLMPKAWSHVVEQWGAAQLQSRFIKHAGRSMQSIDYAAWAGVRSFGEAFTRVKKPDVPKFRKFFFSRRFSLAGFKGRKLTFRKWNGQLRQPIPLVHAGAVVAQAPFEGFLHQRNELDSLGIDEPESACKAF